MSRIGGKPIEVPSGITLQADASMVTVKGPKGTLQIPLPRGISLEKQDGHYLTRMENDEQEALRGLIRAEVGNAIVGVSQGFEKQLDIVGIGYRAEVKGKSVVFTLGYSHPIDFPIPEGISISVDKQNHLVVKGIDRRLVGQVSANIRGLRPPDPYKNKGVRYTGERLKKKAGKAAGAGGAAKA
jgi:large subunit ribosomal protein L6